ncbi:GntP family permease [Paenibacillus macerans]|uniref:Permease DsdX n=1 Tax=Paenibacillus macerans TaxID=44252 RepID=A0A090ZNK5_PAEMA|nr:GntP family permease [Paenibacillus macerans]KFN11998.1 transporter, gluconate:H+ symporter family protein [Paenibacillus macerans]MBS5912376.1 GntP family permease [Paenibacillus macerans]MCY7559088.1 GntP family permease [Paenibacillus macerans]MEC0136359.1 GntP family permease [Paenibacillus macerans]MEC0154191.1 GntP family permease [Paenibacillus macerans]
MGTLFGMSHNATLLLWTLIVIVFLVLLISKYKWNPFVTLLISALLLGLLAGMKPLDVVSSITGGLGGTLGTIAIVIGLGTMLGKMMAESGGAERIATTLIDRFGEQRVHWAMMLVGFIVGIPVFFEVGVILLIPIVFTVAKKTNMSLLQIGIPILAGLSTVHGLVPPHPAPMIAIDAYGADLGRTILYSLLVGLPVAIIAGPLFGKYIGKRIALQPPAELAEQFAVKEGRKLPSFGMTLFTILLPVILMLIGSLASIIDPKATSPITLFCEFIGHEIMALLIAVVFSFFSLGYSRGFSKHDISKFTSECLAPIASIVLIIGAGGAFKQVLINSGVGQAIAEMATGANINIIFFSWLVAALIRVATGSATVAMTTAAGIVAPVLALTPGANVELAVLATGAGSIVLSHVNDAGFWMVKEFFNMSVPQTLKSWTAMETILSVVGLVLILILSFIF